MHQPWNVYLQYFFDCFFFWHAILSPHYPCRWYGITCFSSSKNSIIYTLHSHWHTLTSFNLIGHLCFVRPLTLIFFVNVKIIFFIFLIGSINVCTITLMVFGGHVTRNGFKIGVLSKCTCKVETYETCSEHTNLLRESTWLQWPSNLFLLQYNSAF